MEALPAVAVSGAVAVVAWRTGALTRKGGVAAAGIGAAVLFGTGWTGALMLAGFFVPSTLVGRLALARGVLEDPAGERRTATQVLANGGAAALGSLLERAVPGLGLWIVCGCLSAASADTWATSLGAFSGTDPRHLVSGRRVPRGTSGAVSMAGMLAALAGAAMVAGSGSLAGGGVPFFVAGITIGFGGMLLDSLLGATLQGGYECPRCGVATERRRHRCGTRAIPAGGVPWLDNDTVNALTTTLAGIAASGWWTLSR